MLKLIPGTLHVDPLSDYGVVEVGEHHFFQQLPGKPEKLVEVSLFTDVWKQDAGSWKLGGAQVSLCSAPFTDSWRA